MAMETLEFKTEVQQLLDLMIHSLYSNEEIFLRELVSNASDAIDKRRIAALTDDELAAPGGGWKIKLIADEEAGTLTVRDNGIGMTRDEAIESLGTIAHSGTKAFLEMLDNEQIKDNPELIGQFGVGFYSAFMVADKVTVFSRKAGTEAADAVRWASEADGSFTVEAWEKDRTGTDVIVTFKEDAKKYLKEWTLRDVVKKYSNYVEHPITMDVTRTGKDDVEEVSEETLNSMKAIWLKDRADITEEEYKDFYQHVSHDFADAARTIHYRAEGVHEFSVLLFIPGKAPFNIHYPDFRIGPVLYVRRVQIMDHCEDLVPKYLRFLQGVVDSSDLPLNVSREILQNNRQVEVIRKSLTKKVLETLQTLKTDQPDDYKTFHTEFGRVLNEGIHSDYERREEIAGLLLFESTETKAGETTTLDEYVERMKDDQKDIYFITGSSRAQLESSPLLEAFTAKGYEVLLMTDEVDDVIFAGLGTYQEKPLKSVVKGDVDLGDDTDKEEAKEQYGALIELVAGALDGKVSEVRLSGRLKGSPCCLVTGDNDLAPGMERVLKQMGQEVPTATRVLELNPDHELLSKMQAQFEADAEAPQLKEYAGLLYDQALLLEGSPLDDPAAFARSITKLMVSSS